MKIEHCFSCGKAVSPEKDGYRLILDHHRYDLIGSPHAGGPSSLFRLSGERFYCVLCGENAPPARITSEHVDKGEYDRLVAEQKADSGRYIMSRAPDVDILITISSSPAIMAQVMERWVRENSPKPFHHHQAEFHLIFEGGKTFRPIHLPAVLAPPPRADFREIDLVAPVRFIVCTSTVVFQQGEAVSKAVMSVEQWREMFMDCMVSVGTKGNVIGKITSVEKA